MKLSERLIDQAEGYGSGPLTIHETDIKHLQWLLRQAAAVIKRYEDAPVAELYHTRHERNQYYGELYAENLPDGWEPAYTAIADGQRVRLVVEGGEG